MPHPPKPFAIDSPCKHARARCIVAAVTNTGRTAHGIAIHTGLSRETVNKYLRALPKGTVHICRWTRQVADRNHEYPTAVWLAGPGRNARKPKPKYDPTPRVRKPAPTRRPPRPPANHSRVVEALREHRPASPFAALVTATLAAQGDL